VRYELQKPARTKLTATDRTDEVVVKFREGSRVRLRGGKLDSAAAADIAPHTSSSQAMQNYMWDAPRGVSASRAWARPGAGGNGLWFADIETGWRTDHEDFPNYIWRRGWNVGDVDHGTASVGVTSAPPNPYGVSGISAWATVNLYGIVQAIPPWDPSGTINLAASHLIPGDVMLIEQHIPGPDVGPCPPTFCNCSQWGFIPVEWNQAEFDAIRSATARGIVVVEPAGNGGQNLDDPRYLNRFNLGVRDSEAVMVGAINSGEPGSGASFGGTSCFSDFGSRVDVSAWGDSVVPLAVP
jgi:serine protease